MKRENEPNLSFSETTNSTVNTIDRPSSMAEPPPSNNPTWSDDFFNFSSVRRGVHRHSISDPVAFPHEFDFDGEQFMSIFSDADESLPLPTPTTMPAVENCNAEEMQMQIKCEAETEEGIVVDPKRVKRILANRQSAQRSRLRKLQYISELERNVSALENEVSSLSPRVAFLDQQRTVLAISNGHFKQRIAALVQEKLFRDAHHDELKKEIERLRRLYKQQQMIKGFV